MKLVHKFLLVGLGTFILSLVGLYNGYPLVYSDTGTYIYSGFDVFVPFDRPITYGLFLKLFSFRYSAWFVILFQNFISAFVILECLKVFFNDYKKLKIIFPITLLFLVVLTGIGWYSNQLMPDFFAPLVILTYFTLLLRKKISILPKTILILILIYGLITHFSHLMIGGVLAILSVSAKLIYKEKLVEISLKRVVFISSIVLSAWLILPIINYIVEKKYTLSEGSHVFLMGHLVDTGILDNFLKENCAKPSYKNCRLCAFKDSLPKEATSFIWSGDILNKTGGWKNSKTEYDKIISATLTEPKYLFNHLFKSFSYGLIQLTDNQIGHGLSAYNEGSAPYGQIHWRFYNELNNYLNSRQNKWNGLNLHIETINNYNTILLIISLSIVILIFTSSSFLYLENTTKIFLIFVLIAIISNSFITAGLNSPYGRLQTRVVWLLPFSISILLLKNYKTIAKSIYTKISAK